MATITVNYTRADIAQGDSPASLIVGTMLGGTDNNMAAAGWECHFSLHAEDRATELVKDKAVTSLITDGAVQKFDVWLTLAESELLTAPGNDVCKYIWTVQLKNETLARPYREEIDVSIYVRSELVSA